MKYYKNITTGAFISEFYINKKNKDQFEIIEGEKSIELNTEMIEVTLDRIHSRLGWILAFIAIPVIIGLIAGGIMMLGYV